MMKKPLSMFSLLALLALIFALQGTAQEKKAKAGKTSNVQGNVASVDKAKMIVSVKTGGNTRKDVMYTADTKFMQGHSKSNKPGSVDDIKDNYFISCQGTYDAGKVQLQASACVYRETK
jgi:hypothetical protein